MGLRWLSIALFACASLGSVPAWACMASPLVIEARFMSISAGKTPTFFYESFQTVAAGHSARIKLRPPGSETFDIAPSGQDEFARWEVTLPRDGALDYWVSILGKKEGRSEIPLKIMNKAGHATAAPLRVLIDPPPPPPKPRQVVVDKEDSTGAVDYGRPFQIRMEAPLPAGHRWEVKEAVYAGRDGKEWKPFQLFEVKTGDGKSFEAGAFGDQARVVFIQKREGWQLFPNKFTLRLEIRPVPLC